MVEKIINKIMTLKNIKKVQYLPNFIENFIGQWEDENGKKLHIIVKEKKIVVNFYNQNNDAVERNLLGDIKEKSLNMKTWVDSFELVVELGTEGLGPTLRLRYENKDDNEFLVPAVEMGLYDDWEDDFGVPWILPLQSVYYKAQQ